MPSDLTEKEEIVFVVQAMRPFGVVTTQQAGVWPKAAAVLISVGLPSSLNC